MSWWKYYGFHSQPFLDANQPLLHDDDLSIFYGRKKEIESLQKHAETETKTCLLILGDAGIGKTSLQCKAFQNEAGFIRANLSKVRTGESADAEIASSCVHRLKQLKIKASDLDKKLGGTVSRTTGRTLKLEPGGAGVSSLHQKTETLDRNFEVEDITRRACERISAKGKRIVLALDESDFLGDGDPNELSKLCQRVKDVLPRPGVLILANRDAQSEFREAFADTESLVRATFDSIHRLSCLWEPGKGDVKSILEPRFKLGKPSKQTRFSLSKAACYWLDNLSCGNIRELLRYTKHVLIEGANVEEIPLHEEFVVRCLLNNFPELGLPDEDDQKVLTYLMRKPSSPSDPEFVKVAGSRTTMQRRLEVLEKRWLVERDTKIPGKRQIYRITKKAQSLLEIIE